MLSVKKLLYKILGMLTVSSTHTITACGKPWYFHKVGRTVYFDAPSDIGSASAGINNLGTLPQAFRPQVQQRLGCGNKASWNAFVQISTNGEFILYTSSAITSTSNGAFSATYLSAS